MKTARFVLLLLAVSLPGPGWGHDLWIEPSRFGPASGQTLAVRLRVGQQFAGDPLPRSRDLLKDFLIVGPEGAGPVAGVEGNDPAGFVRIATSGLHVLGYQSHPFRVEVEPVKFEAYLQEEGLDSIAFLRQRDGTTGEPGREKFSRCAKALIQAGTGEDRVSSRPLGFTAELIPELESFPLALGDRLTVQLLFEGTPLSGALVSAFPKKQPTETQNHRSDTRGRASFLLNHPGVWLVKSVHMIPGGGDVDWESFWASLTFEVEGE